mgnify:FL=1|jgi:hypothetical protein
MNFARTNRAVIALLLYSCMLFSSFACALGHGQSSGLQLSGIAQLQCGSGSNAGKDLPAAPGSTVSFECPACNGHNLLPGTFAGWSLQLPAWPSGTPGEAGDTPALFTATVWPPANPRAPPLV